VSATGWHKYTEDAALGLLVYNS